MGRPRAQLEVVQVLMVAYLGLSIHFLPEDSYHRNVTLCVLARGACLSEILCARARACTPTNVWVCGPGTVVPDAILIVIVQFAGR